MILSNVLSVMLLEHLVELANGTLAEDASHYLAVGLLGDVSREPADSLWR